MSPEITELVKWLNAIRREHLVAADSLPLNGLRREAEHHAAACEGIIKAIENGEPWHPIFGGNARAASPAT
jgi:hypothetical protein